MGQWLVRLVGDEHELAEISARCTGTTFSVLKEGDGYFLRADAFEHLADPSDVREQASEWAQWLRGSSWLALRSRGTVTPQEVRRIEADGTGHIYMYLSDTINVSEIASFVTIQQDGTTVEHHPADAIHHWIEVAQRDASVAKVLRLLALSRDWVNLYRVLEVIEEDLRGRTALASAGWVTASALRRFKHTANSVGATGDDARHGKESGTPPKSPMMLSEAAAMVEFVVHRWLQEKLASS